MSSIRSVSSQSLRQNTGQTREILAITVLTLAGAVIRVWSLGRLGLVHFDEGIYALGGLWSLSPGGLQSLDPTYIAYSPPGFPILVGLSYLGFGVSDVSAIVVSIIAGTATIPLLAWLSLRTFGRGAGAVGAALAAGSAVHVSYSRMALTDVSFLFTFLVALWQGQRFLERPNPARALMLGLCVGVAQLLKYNGWIAGMIVALAAALGPTISQERPSARTIRATWGWGLLAISLAAIVYWPWFQFVETHGGYRLLLAHQRGYLNGPSRWVDHWSLQLAQARALCGSLRWRTATGIAAAVGFLISASDIPGLHGRRLKRTVEALGLASLCAFPNVEWWAPLGWIGLIAICRIQPASPAMVVLGVAWLSLSIMTPFYHPYARLWLPLHALGWIVIGGLFVAVRTWFETAHPGPTREREIRPKPLLTFSLAAVAGLGITLGAAVRSPSEHRPGPLEPTDSLRMACQGLAQQLPTHVSDLRLFCRPAVAFYLASGRPMNLRIQPTLDRLLESAGPATWCLLDTALTRQDHRSISRDLELNKYWVTVRGFPTRLNLPTLLDIDPGSCYERSIDESAPLLLLRPGQPEEVR